MRRVLFPLLVSCFATTSPALASSLVTVTVGDDDCFGLNIDCPDFIPEPDIAAQPFDNSTASDPAKQDIFGEIGRASFDVMLDLTGIEIANATLTARVWGNDLASYPPGTHPGPFGDAFAGARFIVNGVDVGTYFAPSIYGPQTVDRVQTVMFDVMADTLVTGLNTITIIPEEDFIDLVGMAETYAIDYVSLSYAPIPLPGGLPLALGAFGLLGWIAHRRG